MPEAKVKFVDNCIWNTIGIIKNIQIFKNIDCEEFREMLSNLEQAHDFLCKLKQA